MFGIIWIVSGRVVQWSQSYKSRLTCVKIIKILRVKRYFDYCRERVIPCKLPSVPKGVKSAWSIQIQIVSSCIHFGDVLSCAEYLRKPCKNIRAFCSRNEPVAWSVFTHFILCIFIKSGMHLTFRFIFEILMSCTDLISLNWLYNWHNTYLTDW